MYVAAVDVEARVAAGWAVVSRLPNGYAEMEPPPPPPPAVAPPQATAPTEPTIAVAFFKDKKDKRPKAEALTWQRLCDRLRNGPEVPDIESLPMIKGGNFKGTRSAANLDAVQLVVGDYDAGQVPMQVAVDRLRAASIRALVHNTRRHSPEAPRWRVTVPLSRPVKPDEYLQHVELLNNVLGGVLAPESAEASRCFFYGRVRGVPFDFETTEGDYLDDPIGPALIYPRTPLATTRPKPQPATANTGAADDLDRAYTLQRAAEDSRVVGEVESAVMHLYALPEFADGADNSYDVWTYTGMALASLAQAGQHDEALRIWHSVSEKSPRYDFDQAQDKFDSFSPNTITFLSLLKLAQEKGWQNPRAATSKVTVDEYLAKEDWTDVGNATRFARLTAGDARYVPERKQWLVWSGGKWQPDPSGAKVHQLALRVAHSYSTEAAEYADRAKKAQDPDQAKALQKIADRIKAWEIKCRAKSTIDNLLAVAARIEILQVAAAQLDADRYLLGVQNGAVDLRTGELRPDSRDLFITKRCIVAYDPKAPAPRFEQFVLEITGMPGEGNEYTPREHLALYLQRMLGYACTGLTREQKFFVWRGDGSNGKNVLIDAVQEVLGDYATTIAADALMAGTRDADPERATPQAAALAGARLVVASETKEGRKLDVALIKSHTGDKYMTARQLHQAPVRFEITHKIVLLTNPRPAVDHLDDATRGRIHILPFERRWNRPGHAERDELLPDGDPDLGRRLAEERAGILAWLVRGAAGYLVNGLPPPAEVIDTTRAFFAQQDALGQWLASGEVEPCHADDGTLARELFNAFERWTMSVNLRHRLDLLRFGQGLAKVRIEGHALPYRDMKNGRRWGLRPTAGDMDL
jgi:P4 family phage/plasmid primase-like protien